MDVNVGGQRAVFVVQKKIILVDCNHSGGTISHWLMDSAVETWAPGCHALKKGKKGNFYKVFQQTDCSAPLFC